MSVSNEENYRLVGLSSDEPDYKLCWMLNERMRMAFLKTANLKVFNKKLEMEQEFSQFLFEDENAMLTYRLIGNRSDNGVYLDDLKNIDYILHIQGEIRNVELAELTKRINTVEMVRMCVPVDLSKVRQKDRLQLW